MLLRTIYAYACSFQCTRISDANTLSRDDAVSTGAHTNSGDSAYYTHTRVYCIYVRIYANDAYYMRIRVYCILLLCIEGWHYLAAVQGDVRGDEDGGDNLPQAKIVKIHIPRLQTKPTDRLPAHTRLHLTAISTRRRVREHLNDDTHKVRTQPAKPKAPTGAMESLKGVLSVISKLPIFREEAADLELRRVMEPGRAPGANAEAVASMAARRATVVFICDHRQTHAPITHTSSFPLAPPPGPVPSRNGAARNTCAVF